jgi:hypothetical protein
MPIVATKDRATFSEAHKEAVKIQELTTAKSNYGNSTNAIDQSDDSINQIKGNGTSNPYCCN